MEKKNLGKRTTLIGIEGIRERFLSCFFIFNSFNITLLTLLVQVILSRNGKSVKGDSFRWANACVQVGRR